MISRMLIGVVLVGALSVAADAQVPPDDQSISELIGRLRGHDYQQAASWALVRIGAPAVGPLVDALETEGSEPVRRKFVETLGRMRAEAVPALPTLVELLTEGGVEKTVWTAVGDIGPYVEPDASELSASLAQTFRSSWILDALKEHPGAPLEFGPLSLPYFFLRAVSRLDVDPDASTDVLLDLMRSSDNPYTVAFAVQLLAERNADAERLIPHLKRFAQEARTRRQSDVLLDFEGTPGIILKRGDWREAYFAASEAMARIAPRTPEAMPGHRFRLRGGANVRLEDRLASIAVLVSLGASAAEAVPELIASARDENASLAGEAITALGMIGPAARDAIPTLEDLASHENRQISERARASLRQIRGGTNLEKQT